MGLVREKRTDPVTKVVRKNTKYRFQNGCTVIASAFEAMTVHPYGTKNR
jgi:hypothetical protein